MNNKQFILELNSGSLIFDELGSNKSVLNIHDLLCPNPLVPLTLEQKQSKIQQLLLDNVIRLVEEKDDYLTYEVLAQ